MRRISRNGFALGYPVFDDVQVPLHSKILKEKGFRGCAGGTA
jgi:hypothetical protein